MTQNIGAQRLGSKDAMIRHNKTAHTANDYPCEDCDVTFSRSDELGRHIKTVHNEKIYICQHCGKKFGRSDSLKRHIKSIHFHLP